MLGKALQLAAAGNAAIEWPDVSTGTYVRTDAVNITGDRIRGVFFNPEGTKIYHLANTTDTIKESTLSTAWDISTHGSTDASLTTDATHNANPGGLFINEAGTELYTVDLSADVVAQYSMTTAWDLSTASYTRKLDISSNVTTPTGVAFSKGGDVMIVSDSFTEKIDKYTLSTAWDISTASYDSESSATGSGPQGVFLKPDGTKVFIVYSSSVEQYDLSTPFVITGVGSTSDSSLDTSSQTTSGYDCFISPDGAHLYTSSGFFGTNADIDQYSLG